MKGFPGPFFWHELQAPGSYEELNCDFALFSQADRLTVQPSSPADSALGAAPPRSGYFHWQWAKGKPRETGRLCIPDPSFPDAGLRLHLSGATGEGMCETTQPRVSSQQGLYLKVWYWSRLPLFLPVGLHSLLHSSQWISWSSDSFHTLYWNSEQYLIPWHPPQVVNGLCFFSFCPLITAGAEKHLWGLSTICSVGWLGIVSVTAAGISRASEA